MGGRGWNPITRATSLGSLGLRLVPGGFRVCVGLASGDLVAPEPATGRVGLIEAMRFGQHVLICLRFI